MIIVINDWNKQVQQEYKTSLDLVGWVIYRELCQRLKFFPFLQMAFANRESILENDM